MTLAYYVTGVVLAGLCAFAAGILFDRCWLAARAARARRPGQEDLAAEDL